MKDQSNNNDQLPPELSESYLKKYIWKKFTKGLNDDQKRNIAFFIVAAFLTYLLVNTLPTIRAALATSFIIIAGLWYRLICAKGKLPLYRMLLTITSFLWVCGVIYEATEKSHQVSRIIKSAETLYDNNFFSGSFSEYSEACDLAKKYEFKNEQCLCLNRLGRISLILDGPIHAKSYFETNRYLAKEWGITNEYIESIKCLGDVEAEGGNMPLAFVRYDEAIQLARLYRKKNTEAYVLNTFGQIAIMQGSNNLAENYLTNAIKLFKEAKNLEGEGMGLTGIAVIDWRREECETGKKLFYKALNILKEANACISEADTLTKLGGLEEVEGNLQAANSHFNDAKLITDGVGGNGVYAYVFTSIANSYSCQGKPEMARGYFETAQIFSRRVANF